ncbi:MAG: AmmeMemoRadiSam system protein A [Acidimicrobiia bacterium]|nr:AmmeMemoRadiSam system protein A [Acidimicrobiia bacterium]
MAPSPSPEDVELLLDIADEAIERALAGQRAKPPALASLPPSLREPVGVFVTLRVGGELNGCIGALDGVEPLGPAVARLAVSAAFGDPRLPALRPADRPHLTIEISLLSPLEPIAVANRDELLASLRPGTDGLVVVALGRRALFLPAVWEQLPDPERFVDQLWAKAGLSPGTWPKGIELSRFTARHHEREAVGL